MNLADINLERENKRQAAIQRRVRILAIICVMVLGARFFIKNPEPPKKAVHQNKPFRALPGMLARMPASERAKLTPQMLAQLQEADRNKDKFGRQPPPEALARAPMIPTVPVVVTPNPTAASAPVEIAMQDKKDIEAERLIYEKRARESRESFDRLLEENNQRKPMLVLLRNGGYLKAEKAEKSKTGVDVVLSDRQLSAHLPLKMVASVSENALSWKEPVPRGYAKLKPAKGITIIVQKETARRITVQRS